MGQMEWEIAGENPPLTAKECRAIEQAVLASNPDAVFVASWNGAGCYTMSVGVDLVGGIPNRCLKLPGA